MFCPARRLIEKTITCFILCINKIPSLFVVIYISHPHERCMLFNKKMWKLAVDIRS